MASLEPSESVSKRLFTSQSGIDRNIYVNFLKNIGTGINNLYSDDMKMLNMNLNLVLIYLSKEYKFMLIPKFL